MLNLAIGSPLEIDYKKCILTRVGAAGHAIYGPYLPLDPGYYAVEFYLRPAEEYTFDEDEVCAEVDVTAESGQLTLVREAVRLSQLKDGAVFVPLTFHNPVRQRFEFRVQVWGQIPLIIEDRLPVIPLKDANSDYLGLLKQARLPDPNDPSLPEVFRQFLSSFLVMHENNALMRVVDGHLIVTLGGVSFYANSKDDIILVAELFLQHVYNFIADGEWCAIDIGMNIGLASLLLAAKPFVREVHAFEPFTETFERARANLRLNPEIAHKISMYNVGLEDKDDDRTVLINEDQPSGAFTTVGWPDGAPHRISLMNAATMLRPIIEAAKARGRDIVVKVDCEGAEFSIFAALDAGGLLEDISAFMVEWHSIDWRKTQHDLAAPLLRHGFVVFELSRGGENGLFYAVKHRR
jgi:FkbM family methyltransferase